MTRGGEAIGASYFIGFPVQPGELESLLTVLPDGLERTKPADLHVTAAFLGGVAESAALKAFDLAVQMGTAVMRPRLDGLRLLGPSDRPWAVCARLGDGVVHDAIVRLRDPCRAAAGVGPELRAVVAHVTIAAIPRDASPELRAGVARWVGECAVGPATVCLSRVALYTHGREGTRYRVVRSAALG